MLKKILKSQITKIKTYMLSDVIDSVESTLMLLGKNNAFRLQQMDQIDSLSDVEFKIYSQWGEDGIIEWLIQRIPITSHRFIEFGVEDYKEANTRFLMKNRNWKGLVMDANANHIQYIHNDEIFWRYDITASHAFITRDNINSLVTSNGFSGKIGILSIDIDGNDYWIWDALTVVNPDIVICEYNAVFGDLYPITVPYYERFDRTTAHYSNLYYGSSIKALEMLANRKGYILIGSNSAGTNAFFIFKDLIDYVDYRVSNKKCRASLVRESRGLNDELTFLNGLQRLEIIGHLPILRLDTGETLALDSLGPVYSEQWFTAMDGKTEK